MCHSIVQGCFPKSTDTTISHIMQIIKNKSIVVASIVQEAMVYSFGQFVPKVIYNVSPICTEWGMINEEW